MLFKKVNYIPPNTGGEMSRPHFHAGIPDNGFQGINALDFARYLFENTTAQYSAIGITISHPDIDGNHIFYRR